MDYGACSVGAVLVMQAPGPRLDSQNTCVKERAQLHSPVVPAPRGGRGEGGTENPSHGLSDQSM